MLLKELIWGSRGQSQLRHARVGVIGAGGTGSVTAQQLLHLGIGTLITVDSQVAARSNLSRIVGMRQSDIDQTPKVEIVARTAQEIDPSIEVRALYSDVCNAPVLCELRDADLLFLCTDSHWSRAVVNALAVQYRIPLVDMAFAIVMNQAGTQVASATGEVRLVVPGGYCLSCAGVLDADRIRTEQADPGNRAAFPDYFVNLEVEEPSVVTVNSIVASLAVSIGADILIPTMRAVSPFDSYHYNALKGLVRHVPRVHVAACGVCGEAGISGLADDHPLPCA
jgi:molybdopterin/thiamine biosynthesis adenylyltransferase